MSITNDYPLGILARQRTRALTEEARNCSRLSQPCNNLAPNGSIRMGLYGHQG